MKRISNKELEIYKKMGRETSWYELAVVLQRAYAEIKRLKEELVNREKGY